MTQLDIAPPLSAAHAGLKPGSTKLKRVVTTTFFALLSGPRFWVGAALVAALDGQAVGPATLQLASDDAGIERFCYTMRHLSGEVADVRFFFCDPTPAQGTSTFRAFIGSVI